MGRPNKTIQHPNATTTSTALCLHTYDQLRRTPFNRVFAAVYTCAILTLLYHHALQIFKTTTLLSFSLSLLLLTADSIIAFQWASAQSFRFRPIRRREFPENLETVIRETDNNYPAVDIFICTADPYKEPPIGVVNTALSVMAYDYPAEKVSVYVSDDGGSELTLFAFMEAAKFAGHWLPFCRRNNIMQRSPEAYFRSNYTSSPDSENIKTLYENMKARIEQVVEQGKVGKEYVDDEQQLKALGKWATHIFTRQDHPTIIQVLLVSERDTDMTSCAVPNVIYVSREKSKNRPHNFKAGALNVLVRVSAVMTNAPIILTLDCDMYSNDPQTLKRALCYFMSPSMPPSLGYVQFPQIFHGINKDDLYSSEHKLVFQINPLGLDGLQGPNYVGTGCFFKRRALFENPSCFINPELPELSPNHIIRNPIYSHDVLALAHRVAACDYEKYSHWGSKLGFRYGSLVEDFYTGYRLQCEGWRSIFCSPETPAFLGDSPVSLIDQLGQMKRWSIGLLDVLFSKYCPLTFGIRSMGLLMGLAYSYYGCWPIFSIPLVIYAFIPQLSLLHGASIFPKVTDPRFLLYIFMFFGAYMQDLLAYVLARGTIQRWWNWQRMWMISGLSSFSFGCLEFSLKSLGIAMPEFNITNKVQNNELSKRYKQGIFEFGVSSPLFVPITMAAIINLMALVVGLFDGILKGRNFDELALQILLSGFITINCLPIYEAMLLRSDEGRMPTKITIISMFLVLALYVVGVIAHQI
ncbi:hypothetical protein Nepgr_011162 [Nepenthes gracilis]|uniref:Cellulose synthase-like protein G3 n=1 Tax=Nepenthes gracilis TaxID=150966 RepID=A0AAD3SEK4_NEPGR|nr:hypothetical protein Nepgr_011162 [Nepenthes gracilis]